MTNRFLLKQFAENGDKGVFGSYQAGNKTVSSDPATLQSLTAWTNGWADAISNGSHLPAMEEFQAVQYLICKAVKELYSEGIPVWMAGETYYKGAICSYIDSEGNVALYKNITGNNGVQQPALDIINWATFSAGGGGGLEIGDIGIASLPIDETQLKRKYLNGQTILQSEFVAFTTKLKSAIQTYPNLACTESEWQDIVTNSKVGQCGKFVIDDTNGTIRLPRVVRIQGQLTLANIGDIVDESLPTLKGSLGVQEYGQSPLSGVFYSDSSAQGISANFETRPVIKMDANRYSSTYQEGAVVQEEAVQYPYFIQLANGTEEEIDPVREIEFNNPFYFGLSKWSQTKIENLSWLLSDGEFKRGDVYVDFYDWILKNKSGVIDSGISVKTTDETYTDYDFVVNETDGTFRTPLKTLEASGSRVAGNEMTVGLTNGTDNFGMGGYATSSVGGETNKYGTNIGTSTTSATNFNAKTLGITTDPTKSGIETSNQDLFLYWYVGETVQNAHLINAANIMSILNDKANVNAGNFTQIGKNTIIGFGSPDMTTGVTVSAGPFTPDYDGYLAYTVAGQSGGGDFNLKDENGNVIFNVHPDYSNKHGGLVRLSKGTIYEIAIYRLSTAIFTYYKCNGEV